MLTPRAAASRSAWNSARPAPAPMASSWAGVKPFSSTLSGSGSSAQYIAVRSMVDWAAAVRRTSTSSVYCTSGVPRRSSRPLGIDSTRYARAASAMDLHSGQSVETGLGADRYHRAFHVSDDRRCVAGANDTRLQSRVVLRRPGGNTLVVSTVGSAADRCFHQRVGRSHLWLLPSSRPRAEGPSGETFSQR